MSSLATSCVVIRGSASVMLSVIIVSFRWLATALIVKALISFAKLLEPYYTVRSFAVSGSNVLLMFRVATISYLCLRNLGDVFLAVLTNVNQAC